VQRIGQVLKNCQGASDGARRRLLEKIRKVGTVKEEEPNPRETRTNELQAYGTEDNKNLLKMQR
jgi:hypothetical protein